MSAAAWLPLSELSRAAPLRTLTALRLVVESSGVWFFWSLEAREAEFIVRTLRPASGVRFLEKRLGHWVEVGKRLPTAEVPPSDPGCPISEVILPARFSPLPPPEGGLPKSPIRLVRGGSSEPVTALRTTVSALEIWANRATSDEIALVTAARRGDAAILLGKRLPTIPAATRYWGETLFLPVGFHVEPDVSAAVICRAAYLADDELLFLDEESSEIVPRTAFTVPTRAGLRLAARGGIA